MAGKTKFNWYDLDRYTINDYMLKLGPKLIGQEIPIDKFQRLIATHIRKIGPIKVKKTRDLKVETNQVWLGGCYHSDKDEDRETSIELIFVYAGFEETIKISSVRFKKLAMHVADTLLHEIIHMRQFRKRKFKYLADYDSQAARSKVREEQSYLGCADEIDAYSFNIACELHDKFQGDRKQILQYLDENQKGKVRRHNSWRMYLKAFQHDHRHPIIQKVKKKAVKYLPHAEVGKPFRKNEWINR